jgi:hypothetical protein
MQPVPCWLSGVQVCLELNQTWMESGVSEDAVSGHIQVRCGHDFVERGGGGVKQDLVRMQYRDTYWCAVAVWLAWLSWVSTQNVHPAIHQDSGKGGVKVLTMCRKLYPRT